MALRYDLNIEQGADYPRTFPVLTETGQLVDISGWTAAGQIRASYTATAVLYQLNLTPSPAGVVLLIPAAASTAWTWRVGRYDIEITAPDGAVTRLVEGSVLVRPQITR